MYHWHTIYEDKGCDNMNTHCQKYAGSVGNQDTSKVGQFNEHLIDENYVIYRLALTHTPPFLVENATTSSDPM